MENNETSSIHLKQEDSTRIAPLTLLSWLAAGVIISNYLPSLKALWTAVILFLIIAFCAKPLFSFPALNRFLKFKPSIFKVTIAIAFGILLNGLAWQRLFSWSLPSNLVGVPVTVQGYIEGIPAYYQDYTSFTLHLIRLNDTAVHHKIALKWYHRRTSNRHTQKVPTLTAGDHLTLTVKLKEPIASINPGTRDQEKIWAAQGIRAVGYVVDGRPLNQTAPSQIINRWRTHAIHRLKKRLALVSRRTEHFIQKTLALNNAQLSHYRQISRSSCATILSLVLGYHQELSREDWQTISLTGIGHLLAISGMHISLVAYAVNILTAALIGRRHTRLFLIIPKPKLTAMVSLLAGGLYALATGCSIATQRALIMLLISTLATLTDRALPALTIWRIALIIITILHPLSALQTGFWLSFAASFIMIALNLQQKPSSSMPLPPDLPALPALESKTDSHSFSRQLITLQFNLLIALAPLNLWFFKQITLLSLIANPVVIPIITVVALPAALIAMISELIGCASISGALYFLVTSALQLVWWFIEGIARIGPKLCISYSLSSANVFICLLCALLTFKFSRALRCRYCWLLWLIPLVMAPAGRPKETGEFWASVLDVGQGLSTVIRTKRHLLIYDAGPGNSYSNSGQKMVLPFLLDQHLGSPDLLMVSHGDNDHIGGADAIIKEATPDLILTSAPQLLGARRGNNAKYRAQQCLAGQHWQWDDVTFTVLHPDASFSPHASSNNRSCVLKVDNGHYSMLLTGDIERPVERRLLGSSAKSKLASTILVAPHHGSATSSTEEFIGQVAPRQVVFAAGYRNRFRLPNKRVVDRYRRILPAPVLGLWNTAFSGTVTFKVKKHKMKVEAYRQNRRRIWRNSNYVERVGW